MCCSFSVRSRINKCLLNQSSFFLNIRKVTRIKILKYDNTLRGTEKASQVDHDAVNGNIQTAMLSYIGTLDSVQSIILENKEVTLSIEETANVIRFTGSKTEGRFGLFPVNS